MKFARSVMVCCPECVFPEGKALSGEASPDRAGLSHMADFEESNGEQTSESSLDG